MRIGKLRERQNGERERWKWKEREEGARENEKQKESERSLISSGAMSSRKANTRKVSEEWAKKKTTDKGNWLLAVCVVYCCDRFGYDFEIFLYFFYSRKFHLNRAHQSSIHWRIQFLFQRRMQEETNKKSFDYCYVIRNFFYIEHFNNNGNNRRIHENNICNMCTKIDGGVTAILVCSCNPKMNSHQW